MIKITFKQDYVDDSNSPNIRDIVLNKVMKNNHPINNISYNLKPCSNHDWGLPYNAGYFCITKNASKYAVAQAMINIDDWINIQASALGMSDNVEKFLQGAYDNTKERVEEDVKNNKVSDIPAPVLELKPDKWPRDLSDGDTVIYEPRQEGRSRALGAKNAGMKWLPIWVAVRRIRR